MQNYNVKLISPMGNSYRCQKAADSVNLDPSTKSVHELSIDADIPEKYNIGLIYGASGSGKTTLAKEMFGKDFDFVEFDETLPLLDQFSKDMTHEEVVELITGVGLTSIPCWIRPMYTLSNGQKARAIAALAMSQKKDIVVIDEWTSVVDRKIAKIMSHKVQKYARKANKTIVLLSCHYDIKEWVKPDWMIDCNEQTFIKMPSLQEQERSETLEFSVREVKKKAGNILASITI